MITESDDSEETTTTTKPTAVSAGFSFNLWTIFSIMYLLTSPTGPPYDKLEVLWRMLAGPLNFLPI